MRVIGEKIRLSGKYEGTKMTVGLFRGIEVSRMRINKLVSTEIKRKEEKRASIIRRRGGFILM